jgi:murein DD-endopeptidase MepM/ murein hydrolase activator NlpD
VASKRYTLVIADRSTGIVHRFTVSLRPAIVVAALLFSLPVLIGMGARWSARAEINALRLNVETLDVENASYRAATQELTTQISSIEAAVTSLAAQSKLDPESQRALAKLPQIVRTRAMGGGSETPDTVRSLLAPSLPSPEDTFSMVRDLLARLETRLQVVQTGVERRAALAAATPSIWPAIGWLSAQFGNREDPIKGGTEYHTGLDISLDPGQPVYATAAGKVEAAFFNGAYGKMVVINHGFGLVTRYAHLSGYAVAVGDQVERGRVIGYVGSTGRTTGPHLHYELLVNGQVTDPLRLLTMPRR